MKFLIVGAGAIGAYIGARMANAGFDVTLFARGPHLRAMQEHGVQVKGSEGDFVARPAIAGSLEEVGPVDVVFLGVKGDNRCKHAEWNSMVVFPGIWRRVRRIAAGARGSWRSDFVGHPGALSGGIDRLFFNRDFVAWSDSTYRGQPNHAG
jgi:choline dehydrogenase-like flavoprotein